MESGWSAYEVFSVISGALLVIIAFLPGIKVHERLLGLLVGGGLIGYGIYVSQQADGEWVFPAVIFVLPPVALIYGGFSAYAWFTSRNEDEQSSAPVPNTEMPAQRVLQAPVGTPQQRQPSPLPPPYSRPVSQPPLAAAATFSEPSPVPGDSNQTPWWVGEPRDNHNSYDTGNSYDSGAAAELVFDDEGATIRKSALGIPTTPDPR